MKPSIATTHTLHIPATLKFQVTPEQFATLANHNRDLHLERTATGGVGCVHLRLPISVVPRLKYGMT
ncbi:hypothetical protein [Baaleninema simplex]|uniref:hypothetical protein n=1 Tax=Baaleninema simplex TaxID=2862350 RepID=UPI00034BCCEA